MMYDVPMREGDIIEISGIDDDGCWHDQLVAEVATVFSSCVDHTADFKVWPIDVNYQGGRDDSGKIWFSWFKVKRIIVV